MFKEKFVDKAHSTSYIAPKAMHNRRQTEPDHKYELTISQKLIYLLMYEGLSIRV